MDNDLEPKVEWDFGTAAYRVRTPERTAFGGIQCNQLLSIVKVNAIRTCSQR